MANVFANVDFQRSSNSTTAGWNNIGGDATVAYNDTVTLWPILDTSTGADTGWTLQVTNAFDLEGGMNGASSVQIPSGVAGGYWGTSNGNTSTYEIAGLTVGNRYTLLKYIFSNVATDYRTDITCTHAGGTTTVTLSALNDTDTPPQEFTALQPTGDGKLVFDVTYNGAGTGNQARGPTAFSIEALDEIAITLDNPATLSDQAQSTVVTSESKVIGAVGTGVAWSVDVGNVKINGGAGATSGTISTGDTYQFEVTTPAYSNGSVTQQMTVGTGNLRAHFTAITSHACSADMVAASCVVAGAPEQRTPLVVVNPRPSAELTTDSRYTHASSNHDNEYPIQATGGRPPYFVKLQSPVTGVSIVNVPGQSFAAGKFCALMTYTGASGTITPTIVIEDQAGNTVTTDMSITVDNSKYVYLDAVGGGSGAHGSPITFAEMYTTSAADSTHAGKTAVFQTGTHIVSPLDTANIACAITNATKPVGWIRYPGQSPTIDQRGNVNWSGSVDCMMLGLTIDHTAATSGTGGNVDNSRVVSMGGATRRFAAHDITWAGFTLGAVGTDNEAMFWCPSQSPDYHQYVGITNCRSTFVLPANSGNGVSFSNFYTMRDGVVADIDLSTGSNTINKSAVTLTRESFRTGFYGIDLYNAANTNNQFQMLNNSVTVGTVNQAAYIRSAKAAAALQSIEYGSSVSTYGDLYFDRVTVYGGINSDGASPSADSSATFTDLLQVTDVADPTTEVTLTDHIKYATTFDGTLLDASGLATGTLAGLSGLFGAELSAYPAGADTTPDTFDFTDQTEVATSEVRTSDSVAVTGMDAGTAISVTGGTYSINGGAFTATPGTIDPNDTLRLQVTSSASVSTAVTVTVTVGTLAVDWSVTTSASGGNEGLVNFTNITDARRAVMLRSGWQIVSGLGGPGAISVDLGEYQINGNAFTSVAGTVNNGDLIRVRHRASASYGATVTQTLTVAGTGYTFATTTPADPAPADSTPDAADFTNATGAAPKSTVVSDTIAINGISNGVAISVTGGEYQIVGEGVWKSFAGVINNGQSVKVRTRAPALYSDDGEYAGASTVTLTVGTAAIDWTVDTATTPAAVTTTRANSLVSTDTSKSARDSVAITPADGTFFAATQRLNVTTAGDAAVTFASGSTATIALTVGYNDVSVIEIKATGTTAAGITALYA